MCSEMKRLRQVCYTAVILAAAPSQVNAADVFAPSTPWTVNGEDGRCVLSRSFSDGPKSIDLVIESLPMAELVFMIRDTHRTGRYAISHTDIDFGDPKSKGRQRMMESFDSADGVHRIYRGSASQVELAGIASRGSVTLSTDGSHYFTLDVAKFGSALSVLRKCEDIVVSNAAISLPEASTIKKYPELVSKPEYEMPDFIKMSKTGDLEDIAIVSLVISPEGIPTSCNVVHRAKSETLNGACVHALSDHFVPARNSAGEPIRGIYFIARRWDRSALYLPPGRRSWFYP